MEEDVPTSSIFIENVFYYSLEQSIILWSVIPFIIVITCICTAYAQTCTVG